MDAHTWAEDRTGEGRELSKICCDMSGPERHPNQGTVILEQPLTRSAMADFLGLTIETVSRQMTALRKEGIIEMEKSKLITITNLEALNATCGC